MAGIRSFTIKDVSQAKYLSDAEGWNQTDKDWELMVTAPGNECLAFTMDEKIVATATAMTYGKELAWIGMVLVHREYRGKGISKKLMIALLDKLTSFKSIKLDATPAGQPVYQKLGFKNEYQIYRMTSEAICSERIKSLRNTSAEQLDDAGFSEVMKYDQQVMGINREKLLKYLFKQYPQMSLVLKRQNKIKGFVLGREGTRFHQIGPLVAETIEDAKELLTGALFNNVGNTLVVDVPEDKEELMRWLKNAGFSVQRSFMRMDLCDTSIQYIPEKYFLIGGPEVG